MRCRCRSRTPTPTPKPNWPCSASPACRRPAPAGGARCCAPCSPTRHRLPTTRRCCSGILAIAAALHGAEQVDAVDIDASAVESTQANALANGVTLRAGQPYTASGDYGLVFANILATPLKLLAPLLCAHVAAGGDL